MLVAIGPGSQRAGPHRPAGGWQASTSGPGWRDSRRAMSLSRAVSGPVGGAADVEGDRRARLGEEEPVDLVDGEPRLLDLSGGGRAWGGGPRTTTAESWTRQEAGGADG